MITMSFIENETKVEKFKGLTQKLDIKKANNPILKMGRKSK